MSEPAINRRRALRQLLGFAAGGAAVAAGLGACGKSGENQQAANACVDMDALSVAEAGMRKSVHYVERSSDPAKMCKGCAFFTPADDGGACGKCQMFSGGPANADGHCDSWAGKS
jgi:hypothetical protein